MRNGAAPRIFLLGSPRSGTSWVARIFDSHPDVLYRHEPDSALDSTDLPVVPDPDRTAGYADAARALCDALADCRRIKTVSYQPTFPKSYRSRTRERVREGLILIARGVERVVGSWGPFRSLSIPDLIDRRPPAEVVTVMKSVISLARLPAIAGAMPDMPIVHIVRHPGGVAASVKRGVRLGKLPGSNIFAPQLALPPARRRGVDAARVASMDALELSAWSWLIMNEFAMEAAPPDARVRVVRYEDLCADPIGKARELFAWSGLEWAAQTERFLESLLRTRGGGDGFFDLVRNPLEAANRWRQELTAEERVRVEAIALDSEPGGLFRGDR